MRKNDLKRGGSLIARFLFYKKGIPRRHKEYRRKFHNPRPKTFRPPSNTLQEKWVKPMNQKRGKRPQWRVFYQETNIQVQEKGGELKRYVFSPNYPGKNPMTRTHWRSYQRNKKVDKEASMLQWKVVQTLEKKKYYPKGRVNEK